MPERGRNTDDRSSRSERRSGTESSSRELPAVAPARPRARPASSTAPSHHPTKASGSAVAAKSGDSSSRPCSGTVAGSREINRGLYATGSFVDPARPELKLPESARARVANYNAQTSGGSRDGPVFRPLSGSSVTQPEVVRIQERIAALDHSLRNPQGTFQDMMSTAHTYMTGIRLSACATASNAITAQKTLTWLYTTLNGSERTLMGLQDVCPGGSKRAEMRNQALALIKLQRDMLSTYPGELAKRDFQRGAKWEEWRKLNEESQAAFQRDEAERKARGLR